jgi:osmotically-inducible protein OsmY
MKTDSQLQADVMQELKWDPSITHEHIGVAVSDCVVTLSGTVPSYLEKNAAETATQRVSGVKAVVEKIEVKIPGSYVRDDQTIAKAALDALQWHVQVPDKDIKLSVSDGWITLEGDVEWEYQRRASEEAVRALSGVKGIWNNIAIKAKVQPSDVKTKIEQALKRAAEREARRIDVTVRGSKVILTGKVHSFAEMRDVRGAAWGDPGVTEVEDNLSVAA